jgi:hypothetical protein
LVLTGNLQVLIRRSFVPQDWQELGDFRRLAIVNITG